MATLELLPSPQTADDESRDKSILIIEDHEEIAESLALRLDRVGFETLVALNGHCGLQLAHEKHPDLILLDLGLPDTDGLIVGEELDAMADTCTIPVIVLSAMDRPDIVRACRAKGCRYFLRKPYDPDVLLVLIEQVLRETRGVDW